MPVLIPLANTPTEVAVVDDEDAARVNLYTWKRMMLHRFILGLRKGDRRLIDHKSRSALDCRKENLHIVTASGNHANVTVQSHSKTGQKGVCWASRERKWRASISWEGTTHHLGDYRDKAYAGLAYNTAAERLHGEYAVPNALPEAIPDGVAESIRQRVAKHLGRTFRKRHA